MQCRQCQHENPAGAKFCNQCAAPLLLQCLACATENPPGAKFCHQCATPLTAPAVATPGTPPPELPARFTSPQAYTPRHLAEKILTSRSALEGERKQVTVCFCDMANSTAIAMRLGPDNMYALFNRFFELALNAVHRYEGTINQFLGDGFMALFGAPIAHEDHARRAVLAALDLQHMMHARHGELGEAYGVRCAFRMGLNSGLVVVGSIGDNLRMDYSAVGDTTNVAARLQQLAEPDTILVSESTQRLSAGYIRLEALPPVQVKGLSAPLTSYKVVGTRPQRSPVVAYGERALSRFVGRERELAVLEELMAQVEAGHGQIVGIVSEAGGGKSRLLYEFRQRLAGTRVTYLAGRCLSYGRTIPYHPLIDMVRYNCGITETDSPATLTGKVQMALQEVSLRADDAAPYLCRLLGVEEGTEGLAVLSPEAIKHRTFETLRQMSLNGSQQRPLICEIEDLHWIDKTSEEYLTTLVENLAGAAILLLVTYRPGYRPPWLDKSYATQLALRQLVPQDGVVVVRSVAQRATLPERLEQVILTKAEGNPFFLEELTRAVLEHGDLQAAMVVPDTIQGVLMARIDRLREAPKRLLQTASVLGREFSLRLLTAIWDSSESPPPLLQELTRLEFLYERTGVEEPTYIFKHALTQEVAYTSLLTTRRQALHAAAGQALEAWYGERLEEVQDRLAYHYAHTDAAPKAVSYLTLSAQPELLAHHYIEAGFTEKAIGYLQQAGERCVYGAAYAEAISHLNKGLELVATLPATSERMQQELALQLALGPALRVTQGQASSEVEKVYMRARDLCQQIGDTSQLFAVVRGLALTYLTRGKFRASRELNEQLLQLAQDLRDRSFLPLAHQVLGTNLFYLGEFASARLHCEQSLALYNAEQLRYRAVLHGLHFGVSCLVSLARILGILGYPDQAIHKSKEALMLARELAHPFSLGFALNHSTLLYQSLRNAHDTQELAEALITLTTEHGFGQWVGTGQMLWGWVLVEQGQVEEGLAQLRQGMAAYRDTGSKLGLPHYLSLLAQGYMKVGQTEEAYNTLAEALSVVHSTDGRFCEAELYWLKGTFLLLPSVRTSSRPIAVEQEAEACFCQALDIACHQQAKSLELRATLSLSRLWQRQGKQAEAQRMLAELYSWFTEGFTTADLQEAKALLEEL